MDTRRPLLLGRLFVRFLKRKGGLILDLFAARLWPIAPRGRIPYFFARSIPSSIIRFASTASPQRLIFTHLPGSRSL